MKPGVTTMRDLAERLLMGFPPTTAQQGAIPAVVVTDRLRPVLVRFFGSDGYASLLHRALMLSRGETPLLRTVNGVSDVYLEGWEQLAGKAEMNQGGVDEARREAVVAITAHLLDLLVAFVGEPLTLRLVREACPNIC